MSRFRLWFVFGVCGLLAACASAPQYESDSRYTMREDAPPPTGDFDISQVVEPVPFYEPPSRGGNRSPYTVWGETYEVMESAEGYHETGIASWYGAKFHGHATSNGETYDMYQLTAAHRSLPLPTFVRVTNLDNGRSTVVRVNDRGPFHAERMIDLSYAAARVLGFKDQGTARVEVKALATRPPEKMEAQVDEGQSAEKPALLHDGKEKLFVQVGAFGNLTSATRLKNQLALVATTEVHLVSSEEDGVHRVWVGPFEDPAVAEKEKSAIAESDLGQPIIISRPVDMAG